MKTKIKEMAKAFGINFDKFPKFAMAPAMIQIDPNKPSERVPGDMYTVVNDGDGWKPVAKVSEKYILVSHAELIADFLEMLGPIEKLMGKPEFEINFQNDGARMFAKVKFPNTQTNIEGDKIMPFIALSNSVDASKKIISQYRAERLVCTNGMTVSDKRFPSGNHSQRHLGETDGENIVQAFLSESLSNVSEFMKAIEKWQGWAKKPISSVAYIEALEQIGFSEAQIGKIFELPITGFKMFGKDAPTMEQAFSGRKDSNLWLAYNAATEFVTKNTENLKTEHERSEKLADTFELLAA